MKKLPAILKARIAGTGLAVRPCVNTYVNTRPVTVETTTVSTDWQGRTSESRTWHNETDTHVSQFQSTKIVNTAVAETDSGATVSFDTDDHVMRVGETVYFIGHSTIGSKAVDVASPRLRLWLTEIEVPRYPKLAMLAAVLTAVASHAFDKPMVEALITGAVSYAVIALLECGLAQLRTQNFVRSRKQAIKALRAAGIQV